MMTRSSSRKSPVSVTSLSLSSSASFISSEVKNSFSSVLYPSLSPSFSSIMSGAANLNFHFSFELVTDNRYLTRAGDMRSL